MGHRGTTVDTGRERKNQARLRCSDQAVADRAGPEHDAPLNGACTPEERRRRISSEGLTREEDDEGSGASYGAKRKGSALA